jgi:hypothetical protein
LLKAQLIDAEGGEQIVVFPPGFEIEVRLSQDGDRVTLLPIQTRAPTNSES